MQGFPSWFNTKQDVLNALTEYPEDTKEYLIKLLTDRLIWVDTDGVLTLTEDTNSRIIQLGFTVQEIIDIVGEVEIVPNKPSYYYVWNENSKAWELDVAKKKADEKKAIASDYKDLFNELDITYARKIALGQSTSAAYSTARAALQAELVTKLSEV